jgi:hypothetical protein
MKDSPFNPDESFFTRRRYLPKKPVDPLQETTFIKYALMDLGEIVPFAFFNPRFIYVTRNGYLGEDRIIVVPSSPYVEIVGLYVPVKIQDAWFRQFTIDNPNQIIGGAIDGFLRDQMMPYMSSDN